MIADEFERCAWQVMVATVRWGTVIAQKEGVHGTSEAYARRTGTVGHDVWFVSDGVWNKSEKQEKTARGCRGSWCMQM